MNVIACLSVMLLSTSICGCGKDRSSSSDKEPTAAMPELAEVRDTVNCATVMESLRKTIDGIQNEAAESFRKQVFSRMEELESKCLEVGVDQFQVELESVLARREIGAEKFRARILKAGKQMYE